MILSKSSPAPSSARAQALQYTGGIIEGACPRTAESTGKLFKVRRVNQLGCTLVNYYDSH